jgi:hypothetical protein
MVDCGAIPLHYENDQGARDWDNCVREIESFNADRRRLVMACIAASTCDELRSQYCFGFGDT